MSERQLSGIGERIRKARTEKRMTAKVLSEHSKVPEKTIYRIETGEVEDPRISSILPLIEVLECSADEILFNHSYITTMEFFKLYEKVEELSEYQQATIKKALNMLIDGCEWNNYISNKASEE